MSATTTLADMRKEYFRLYGRVLVEVITNTETMERTFIVLRTTSLPRVKRRHTTTA